MNLLITSILSWISLLPNFITWDVDPVLVRVFGQEIRYYGLFFGIAFLQGYAIMGRVYKKEGISVASLDRLAVMTIVGTIIGARLGHVLFYEPREYFADPIEILNIRNGGLASHGAAIAIIIAMWLYVRKGPVNKLIWILDRIILAVPIGGALVRMGNLMNSEIYGNQTSLPWGFIFVRASPHPEVLPMHPTAIYEALGYILTFVICWWFYNSQRKKLGALRPGMLFGLFLVCLFMVRFLVEFIKQVQVDGEKTLLQSIGLNLGQLLSIPFIILGLVLWFRGKKRPPLVLDAQMPKKGAATTTAASAPVDGAGNGK